MKSYERESFLKSFILFFSVQVLFLSIVMYQHYNKVLHQYDMKIGNEMMQCQLNDGCIDFSNELVKEIRNKKLHTLYNEENIFMLFKKDNTYRKVFITKDNYLKKHSEIKKHITIEYLLYLFIMFVISVLFAIYAVRPLRQALQLNEEFIKDILHDFNTPLASLNINYKILKKEFHESDAIKRSEEAIKNILSLQNNLHFFLNRSKLQNSTLDLKKIINDRVFYFKAIYTDLNFEIQIKNLELYTNENALVRIIDNLLSNASKYNKENGYIKVLLNGTVLTIKNSGQGIKNPQKIFDRHYKENEVGLGIGLHVVKKLCEELNIDISLSTELGEESEFFLNLSKLITSR